METRRIGALVLAVGGLLLASPLYVPLVLAPGPLAVLVDPVTVALGYEPGSTLLLVGISYVAVALAGLSMERIDRPTFDVLAAGTVVALLLAWLVAWRTFAPRLSIDAAVAARLSSYVIALWPVALGAVFGAATGRKRRRLVLAVALVAGFQLGAILLYSVWPIRPRTLPGFAAIGLSVAILLYDLVFAYPLYRYGRLLSGG